MFLISFVLTFMETFFYWTMLNWEPDNSYGYVEMNVYLVNLIVLMGILGVQYLHFYCWDSLGFNFVMLIYGMFMLILNISHQKEDHADRKIVGGKFFL
jgi:predicted permease